VTDSIEIVLLLASPVHRYEGRPSEGPAPAPDGEVRATVTVRAGLGIVGDRFFNAPAHRRSSVTLFAIESLEAVAAELGLPAALDPAAARRNIVLRGVDVEALRGRRFTVDSGTGPVTFQGGRSANPCAWMDVVLAPGAFRALRGRGGVRCEPLTDGTLTLGPAALRVLAD